MPRVFRGPRRASTGSTMLALTALTAVAIIWGASYPFTKMLFEELTAWQVMAARFAIAAVTMLAGLWRWIRRLSRQDLLRGVFLGAIYGAAQIVQTVGLAHTSASISGFITGLYVVLTPLCAALLLRSRVTGRAWISALAAAGGLAVLAVRGVSFGLGEWLTLAGAALYAVHIVALGSFSRRGNTLGLTAVQVVTVAVLCITAAVPGGFALPHTSGGWVNLLYLAIIAGGAAMFIQTWAQSRLPATRAAVIMATEPVWAAATAIAVLGEVLTWRIGLGGGLMLAAMFIVESAPKTAADPPGPPDLPKIAG